MCLIIDANKAADLAHLRRPYLVPLLKWINQGGRIASGGRLERELLKIADMRSLLAEWSRRGSLVKIAADELTSETERLRANCRSNDPHVLALANLSGADVVVTEDRDLIDDLRDAALVGRRRRIYKENSAAPDRIDRHKQMLMRVRCR